MSLGTVGTVVRIIAIILLAIGAIINYTVIFFDGEESDDDRVSLMLHLIILSIWLTCLINLK